MKREYPDQPIIGIGVVIFKGTDVLLIRRGKPPRKGELSIPGGAQAVGETVRQAAIREVREETGLSISLSGLIDVVDIVRPDASGKIRYHYTLIDFAAEWESGEAVAASDAAEAFWTPIATINSLNLWSETVRIIEQAAQMRPNTIS